MPPHVLHATRRLLAVGLPFTLLYALSNHLTQQRSDVGEGVFAWERHIPFVDWTIWPYLSIGLFFIASFFSGRGALDLHCKRLLLVLAMALVIYALVPLRYTFERPATSGLTALAFEGLAAFDRPYNRAPSLHIAVLVLLWVHFEARLRGLARAALAGWFVLIGVSVLTTYQHHMIDIPAGAAVALACVWLTRPRRRLQSVARKSRITGLTTSGCVTGPM